MIDKPAFANSLYGQELPLDTPPALGQILQTPQGYASQLLTAKTESGPILDCLVLA